MEEMTEQEIVAILSVALSKEMVSFHSGVGKDGKPWTESVIVVKPGASDQEIEVAANTAKALAAQFAEEVERAKQDSESLAARFILERFTTREILDRMDVEFAGSCPMPIRKFGDKQLAGTVAEVYDEHPEAVKWVGITKALELMEDAGADRIIGVVACGKYWHGVKAGPKPREQDPTKLTNQEMEDAKRRDRADSGQDAEDEELARAMDRAGKIDPIQHRETFDGTQPGVDDNTDYDWI